MGKENSQLVPKVLALIRYDPQSLFPVIVVPKRFTIIQ